MYIKSKEKASPIVESGKQGVEDYFKIQIKLNRRFYATMYRYTIKSIVYPIPEGSN
jgi:hypothetical protein